MTPRRNDVRATWALPRMVEVAGDQVVWSGESEQRVGLGRGAGPLQGFLNLGRPERTDPSDVEAFARRWGVLRLCSHGFPETHLIDYERPNRPPVTCTDGWVEPGDGRRVSPNARRAEPVALWRGYALLLASLLRTAQAVRGGKVVASGDWEMVGRLLPEWVSPSGSSKPRTATWETDTGHRITVRRKEYDPAQLVTQSLDRLVDLAAVRLNVVFRDGRPEIEYGSRNLFGGLVVQTLLTATSTTGIAICEVCGDTFFYGAALDRKAPRDGEGAYCLDHSEKKRWNASAQQRLRARRLAEARGEDPPAWAALRRAPKP